MVTQGHNLVTVDEERDSCDCAAGENDRRTNEHWHAGRDCPCGFAARGSLLSQGITTCIARMSLGRWRAGRDCSRSCAAWRVRATRSRSNPHSLRCAHTIYSLIARRSPSGSKTDPNARSDGGLGSRRCRERHRAAYSGVQSGSGEAIRLYPAPKSRPSSGHVGGGRSCSSEPHRTNPRDGFSRNQLGSVHGIAAHTQRSGVWPAVTPPTGTR